MSGKSQQIALALTPEQRAKMVVEAALDQMKTRAATGTKSHYLTTIFQFSTDFTLLPTIHDKMFAALHPGRAKVEGAKEGDGKEATRSKSEIKAGSHAFLITEKRIVADCKELGWAVKEFNIEKAGTLDLGTVVPEIAEIVEAQGEVQALKNLSQNDKDRFCRNLGDAGRMSTVVKGKTADMRMMIDAIKRDAIAADRAARDAEETIRWRLKEVEDAAKDREIALERERREAAEEAKLKSEEAQRRSEAREERLLRLMERWDAKAGMPSDTQDDAVAGRH